MKIVADRAVCVGAGMCVMTAPEVFDQGDDGLVVTLIEEVAAGRLDAVRRSVALCPSKALRVLDD
ncbi:ferredoxin [Frankia sp. CcI156]|jgi:ferredoxin|nr:MULTISPECIES: (4Fe-4S)-binding protein [Frankia]ETA02172.1 ferredoxin [Frankia sp. CcI6]EYT92338.1 ferredoxin [Frankia casuarinae]KDA42855.1 ferredoxin [Frankia sp. BMG5.23]KEZ37506.1 ferredoxin [Frankia sp. CeD]KFB05988.1 ferredoxin [Frankia sp. Allo2]